MTPEDIEKALLSSNTKGTENTVLGNKEFIERFERECFTIKHTFTDAELLAHDAAVRSAALEEAAGVCEGWRIGAVEHKAYEMAVGCVECRDAISALASKQRGEQ